MNEYMFLPRLVKARANGQGKAGKERNREKRRKVALLNVERFGRRRLTAST